MQINAFISRCQRHCAASFQAIHEANAEGRHLGPSGQPVAPVYPSILLVCETPTHLFAELLGATPHLPNSLRVVKRTDSSIDGILGKFNVEPVAYALKYAPAASRSGIWHVAIYSGRDETFIQERYPELTNMHETQIVDRRPLDNDVAFNPLDVSPDSGDLWLRDVLSISSFKEQLRVRYFQTAWLIERAASSSELQRRLNHYHPVGLSTDLLAPAAEYEHTVIVQAANFASLSTAERIGETTITRFLEENESILLAALGGVRLIPQPLLPWREGNPDPSESHIQPDFLIVDENGRAHICEVKLPLLGRTSLTAGGHRRRRFIVTVNDGIAQLGNYNEYFEFPAHQQLVKDKYNITVEDPRLILIVGSAENFDAEETRQALRLSRPVEIVDYDTLRALFIARSAQ
jgi:hypothetical protein